MTLVVQISDTHFGTERLHVAEALLRLVHEHSPDLVVLSGDITQRARSGEFRAARRFIDRLGAPSTLVIPGNHDIPLFNLALRLLAPYAKLKREFGNSLEPIFDSDDLLVIGANTTRRYRHKDGDVSGGQIKRVAERLTRAAAKQLRIVVMHHPVVVTEERDATNLLHGRENAVRSWARAGADLILGGHIHLPYVRALHQVFPDLARSMWAVQAGTAVSSRLRYEASNSVNLIRYSWADRVPRCTIERWDYSSLSERFDRVAVDEPVLAR